VDPLLKGVRLTVRTSLGPCKHILITHFEGCRPRRYTQFRTTFPGAVAGTLVAVHLRIRLPVANKAPDDSGDNTLWSSVAFRVHPVVSHW
jgi:hypothetical protein